ncbi:MAG: hypothetical protein P1P77_14240 [Spirochaetaceae bacterium]|nr:hypothetical protein [Spirochaetaceae bacterium]
MNMNDGSFILVPNIAWDFLADFTAEADAMVFIGGNEDEFGGVTDLGSGPVDLMEPSVFVKLKVSF